jgi:hypothetical protein
MKLRLAIYIVLVSVLVFSASAQNAITSCGDLQDISKDLDGDYVIENEIDCKNKDFQPLGQDEPFSGKLDGKGHTISNLEIIEEGSDSSKNIGLFNAVEGGVVGNLSLENLYLESSGSVGGIAAELGDYAEIRRVEIDGDIKGDVAGGVGGFVENSTIKNVIFEGEVDGSRAGGIVGASLWGKIELDRVVSSAETEGTKFEGSIIGMAGVKMNGAVLGYAKEIINNSYWNSGRANSFFGHKNENSANFGMVKGLEDEEMRGESARGNMEELDYEDVWRTTSGYPEIRMPEYEDKEKDHSQSEQNQESDNSQEESSNGSEENLTQEPNSNLNGSNTSMDNVTQNPNSSLNGSNTSTGNFSQNSTSDLNNSGNLSNNVSQNLGSTPEKEGNVSQEQSSDLTNESGDQKSGSENKNQETKPDENKNIDRIIQVPDDDRGSEEAELKDEARSKLIDALNTDSNSSLLKKAQREYKEEDYSKAKSLASEAIKDARAENPGVNIVLGVVGGTVFLMILITSYFVYEVYKI